MAQVRGHPARRHRVRRARGACPRSSCARRPTPRRRSSSTGRRSTPRAAARSATRACSATRRRQRRSSRSTTPSGRSAGLIVHRGTLHGRVAVGETVDAEVDAERRARTMRNHTGTHLLHRALRNTVGERARQAGSLVTPDYLRFDFPVDRALTDDEKRADRGRGPRASCATTGTVTPAFMTMAEAIDAGADAFFDEKYGETGARRARRRLQPRAVRRHALPRHGPDRRLRHHRRALHRHRHAPHRGASPATPRTRLSTRAWRSLERAARSGRRADADALPDRMRELQERDQGPRAPPAARPAAAGCTPAELARSAQACRRHAVRLLLVRVRLDEGAQVFAKRRCAPSWATASSRSASRPTSRSCS